MKVLLLVFSVLLAVQLAVSVPLSVCPASNSDIDVLIADDIDCSVFYHCDWGEPVLKRCPSELVFDTVINECNYREYVDCDRSSVPVNPGDPPIGAGPVADCPAEDPYYGTYIPDKANCAIYYTCAHGIMYTMQCAPGLHYNGEIWACDFPQNVNCGAYNPVNPYPPIDGPIDPPVVPPVEPPVVPPVDPPVVPPVDPPVVPPVEPPVVPPVDPPIVSPPVGAGPVAECPANDPYYGTYIPDKENCAMYYICYNGNAIPMPCPAGLHYDGIIGTCNFPEYVTCGLYNPAPGDGGPSGPPASGTGPLYDCPETNGAFDFLIPDKTNCALYYQCNWGIAVVKECPGDLVYDTVSGVCNYVEEVNCDRTIDEGIPAPVLPEEPPVGWIELCPEDANPNLYYVSNFDPHNFYACVGNTPFVQSCPADLIFNQAEQICVYQLLN